MSAIGNMIVELQEAVCNAMGNGIVDEEVAERIAREAGVPIAWVWQAHSDLMEDW